MRKCLQGLDGFWAGLCQLDLELVALTGEGGHGVLDHHAALVDDHDLIADRFDIAQNMGGEDDSAVGGL